MMSHDDTKLEKAIHGLFQHAKQKARFLLCSIFQIPEKWQYILYRIAACQPGRPLNFTEKRVLNTGTGLRD